MLRFRSGCVFVLSVATLALAGTACRQAASTATAPPAPAAVSPDVWATVDGREIRRDEIEKAYRRSVNAGAEPSEDEALVAKLNLLDQAITGDILLAKAKELNVDVPQTELDAAFNDAKNNVADDAFNKELAARNLTAADVREQLRRDLVARKLIDREVTAKISVTDKDIADFFEANKAQFNLNEDAFHIAQIIVTAGKDSEINNRTGDDATTPQAAAAKVQMLMERLKGGTPFAELAADYSEEAQSAPAGGDVGLVPMSALRQAPPPLRDAVLKAEPGTVNVVPMEGGYTIVGLVAKEKAGQRNVNMPEVRERITAALTGRREQLLRTAYLEALRSKATVVNHLAQRIVDAQGQVPSLGLATPPR
jgi:parvulin-like peptidyl-prolyl isomerase